MTKTIAIIGASESAIWTRWLFKNLAAYDFEGEIWPVNPGRAEVFGRACFASIDKLPGVADLGIVVLGPGPGVAATRALLAAGTRQILVVGNGFRESGAPEGVRAEQELVEMCNQAGARLYGPNCVGFADFENKLCPIAEPIPQHLAGGPVGLVSHSGALLSSALQALEDERVGVTAAYTLGNSAQFDFPAAIKDAGLRQGTQVVAAVVESLGKISEIAAAIAAGRRRGVEYVFLLLGLSDASRSVTAAHTGTALGEQRLARAWLNEQGVILVDSIPELARTSSLLATIGRLPRRRGVMILTGSGGGASLAGDAAARHDVPLAQLAQDTIAKLRHFFPEGAYVGNPLDVVAGAVQAKRKEVFAAVCADESVGIVMEPWPVVWPDDSPERASHRALLQELIEAAQAQGIPVILNSAFSSPPTRFALSLETEHGAIVRGDLETTFAALRHVYRTPPGQAQAPAAPLATHPACGTNVQSKGALGEAQGRALLAASGLPVVPGTRVDLEHAAAATATVPGPWVVKIGNDGIEHKGRIGGVRVGLVTPEAVVRACEEIAHSAVKHGAVADTKDASFLIQQMVSGPELLVSAVRDETVGCCILVGAGGWLAESRQIFFTIPSSTDTSRYAAAIDTSDLARLLPANVRQQLAAFLASFAAAFERRDELRRFRLLECNPVMLTSSGPLIADVLAYE